MWEKKYEVRLAWSSLLLRMLTVYRLPLAGRAGKASQGANRSGGAGGKHAGPVIGLSGLRNAYIISSTCHPTPLTTPVAPIPSGLSCLVWILSTCSDAGGTA
jgi:hypothetical protein